MPVDQFVLLVLGLVLIAAVAGTVAYATAHAVRREPEQPFDDRAFGTGLREHRADALRLPVRDVRDPRELERQDLRGADPPTRATPSALDRASAADSRQVARVVAFLFLATVAVVVALTRAWPDSEAIVFTLLAAGTLLVVLFMDMLPPATLGRARRPAEGVGAVIFVGLLVGLTDGIESPFFVGFFLVVAGTSLTIEGMAPLLIALLAAATLAFAAVLASGLDALGPESLGWIGFNAVTLILLADIAAAAGRAQRQSRDEVLRASRFDPLTGLFNRAYFFTAMEQEIRRSARMTRGFSMLMLDLDDLKPVNDTFGHQSGDRLLKAVAEVILRTVRFTDSAARYGGDEFVVLLPETDATGAYIVAEKLRRDAAALSLRAADRNLRSSVSVGLVTYPEDGTTIEQLVAAADLAMYESKRRGKNQIVGYKTRTERVATAMEVQAPELVPLGSEESADGGSRTVARAGMSERAADAVVVMPADVVVQGDAPWLTRTVPEPSLQPDAGPDAGPDAPDRREVGREPSRGDEIRNTRDRPWIALPIDPGDKPDRPGS